VVRIRQVTEPGDDVKIEQNAVLPLHCQPHTALVDGDQTGVLVSNSPASHSPAVPPIVTPIMPSRAPASPGHELGMMNDPMANSASSVESISALHSARRMKALSINESRKTPRRGVSIPSQRRFLFYWSQIISGAAIKAFWELPSGPGTTNTPQQQVRICKFTIKMLDPGAAKQGAVKVISKALETTGGGKVHITIGLCLRKNIC